MTIEEARKILLSDADFSGIGEKARLTADALVLALEALEKQIPRKPINLIGEGFAYRDYYWNCPVCHIQYVSEDRQTYCEHCGQKIDWSDEVEE